MEHGHLVNSQLATAKQSPLLHSINLHSISFVIFDKIFYFYFIFLYHFEQQFQFQLRSAGDLCYLFASDRGPFLFQV